MPTGFYEKLTYGGSPFVGATLKVKRAERHLDELAAAARDLPRRRNYNCVVGKPEPGKLQLIFMASNQMPMEFGTVLGDVVHNIRSAFDYIAVIISCKPYGSGNPNHIYFPTGEDRQMFIDARDGKRSPNGKVILPAKMRGARAGALRIVEELEPYGGGKNSAIRALHVLDIIDKHKLIVPAASILHVDELEFMLGDKSFSVVGTDFQANEDGTNFFATIDCNGLDSEKFKRGDKFDASFEIVFGKTHPLSCQSIIPTLSNLCDVAKGFIKTCETHFL